MHYLLQVPEYENDDLRPTDEASAPRRAVEAAKKAFWAKLESLDTVRDEMGTPYGDRLLSLVMLNVLDEKWKDHLYDLDQLRNAIHYRSWGQKDPLIEYKQEAYTMFVDLMNDIYNTFSERFLKVQLVFEPPAPPPPPPRLEAPTKRYNALGILEDIPSTRQPRRRRGHRRRGRHRSGGAPPQKPVTARKDPLIVGAGRTRSLGNNGDRRRTSIGRRSDGTIRVRVGRGRSSRSATERRSSAASLERTGTRRESRLFSSEMMRF